MRTWTNDLAAESKMKFFAGLEFEVKKIQMKDIDKKMSLELNARVGDRVNQATLDEYHSSMSRGDVFPRIVVFEDVPAGVTADGYVIAGGVHRFLSAEKFKDKEIEVYVIPGDNVQIWDLLPLALNRNHGLQASQKEAMIKAKMAVSKHGLSTKGAAELYNISRDTLGKELLAQNMEQRLILLGVTGSENIPLQARQRLHALVYNDVILKATADFLVKNKVATDPAIDLITLVKAQRTEEQALAFLAKEKKNITTLNTSKSKRANSNGNRNETTQRQKFIMVLNKLESVIDGKLTLELNGIYTKSEQEELSARCKSINKKISKIANSYKGKSSGVVGKLTGRFGLAPLGRNGNSGGKRTPSGSAL